MDQKYSFGSDSDDDDDNENDNEVASSPTPASKASLIHVGELEKLKEETDALMKSDWKVSRNRQLVNKMLELEDPSVTVKMVDFLVQEDVCEILLEFITQISNDSGSSSSSAVVDTATDEKRGDQAIASVGLTSISDRTNNNSLEMKLAYRAVMMLSSDEPSDATMTLLNKRAFLIARAMFDIFRDDSTGSFYHCYRMLCTLIRLYPNDVYDAICSDGKATERMMSILRYVGCTPVCELIVMIVSLSPVARNSQLFSFSMKSRWDFFSQLNQGMFLQKLIDVAVNPGKHCYIDATICTAEQQSYAAAQLTFELIEKLSLDETGESLLQPLGYTPAILENLIEASINNDLEDGIRQSSCRLLCFLIRRCVESEIMFYAGAGMPPSVVANRLYNLKDKIISIVQQKVPQICDTLVNFHSSQCNECIKYSGYTVNASFSVLRSLLLEVLVLMVECGQSVTIMIPIKLWAILLKWLLTYAHNNVYHVFFYRLLLCILKYDNDATHEAVLKDAGVLDHIIDLFTPYPETRIPKKDLTPDTVSKAAIRGLLMNCANAIRLQASLLLHNAFLRQYLASHMKWNQFLPVLATATQIHQSFGMGIAVMDNKSAHNLSTLIMMAPDLASSKDDSSAVGSWFAKSIGFQGDSSSDAQLHTDQGHQNYMNEQD